MAGKWLDASRDPVWVQIFPPHYSDTELFAAFDDLDKTVRAMASRGGQFCLISDVSRVRVSNALHRKRIAESFARTHSVLGTQVAGQAFVMRSSVQRGALTAILWLVRPPWPIEVFSTMDEALAWTHTKIKAHR